MEERLSDLEMADLLADMFRCARSDLLVVARDLRTEQVRLVCEPVVAAMWEWFNRSGWDQKQLAALLAFSPSQVSRWPREFDLDSRHVYAAAALFRELRRDDPADSKRTLHRIDRTVTLFRALLSSPALRWPPPPAGLPDGWGDVTASEWVGMVASFEILARREGGPVTPHPLDEPTAAIDARYADVFSRCRCYPYLRTHLPTLGRWRELYRRLLMPFHVLVWVLLSAPWHDTLLPERPEPSPPS